MGAHHMSPRSAVIFKDSKFDEISNSDLQFGAVNFKSITKKREKRAKFYKVFHDVERYLRLYLEIRVYGTELVGVNH